MEDVQLVMRLRKNSVDALEAAIERYTPYVSTVISNQLGGFARAQDVEEQTSDVFLALWQHRSNLNTFHLRGWLGATARNQARMLLRRQIDIPVSDDDVILVAGDNISTLAEQKEQSQIIQRAILALGWPDKEVLLRYYYYNQTVSEIANEMDLNVEAVKSKLRRGRAKLREILEQGGYDCEIVHT